MTDERMRFLVRLVRPHNHWRRDNQNDYHV
uniref:Uncharacterized protein n=1 Tax=Arundo donax TaxID=35708 RepID=A0A0A8YJV0_ARUDO